MKYIKYAYIEKNSHICIDEQKLVKELNFLNIPIIYFSTKQLERNKIIITDPYLVSGCIKNMKTALKQLGIEMPKSNSYPLCLNNFLKRKVSSSNLLNALLDYNSGKSYFIKPKYDFKTFTGDILNNLNIKKLISKYGKEYEVLCSEDIEIISEFRVYVANNTILECVNYHGANIKIDMKVVKECVRVLSFSDENLRGYAIDFAILSNHETVLLELNEGFGIDSYSSNSKTYFEVIYNRWNELLETNIKRIICGTQSSKTTNS